MFAILALLFVGCSNNIYDFPKDLTAYNIQMEYVEQDQKIKASQQVDYVNTSSDVLSFVDFHLYANAFRQDSKAQVVSLSNESKAYPNGKSYGQMNILSVKIKNNDADYCIVGEDKNILQVNLPVDLYPNERVCICFEYEVTLANINHRLGYGNNAINICNFYPIACMYEDGGFVCDLYNFNGDPFYSQVADYNVTIKYPNTYILASSGTKISTDEQDVICTSVSAKCVRDFGLVLSNKFEQKSASNQNVGINYYFYDDENFETTLELIDKTLTYFQETIGKYPYDQISVVQTNFVHGGMEYPNMVMVSDEIQDYLTYQYVVVHELCHQWWYGVVGNNQYKYGWIDEGLTEFCSAMFFDAHNEYSLTMENIVNSATMNYVTFMKVYGDVLGKVDTSMNRVLDEFQTEPEYVYNTYVKGMLMFSSIYTIVGQKRFISALKYYYTHNLYKISTPNIIIKDFSAGTKTDLKNLFDAWLCGKVKIVAK